MRNRRTAILGLMLILGWASHGLSAGLKTGLSYREITSYLSNVIALQRSSPVDGQPRYMGMSADKLSMLEVIGDKSNITQATLAIGVPNDSPTALARNSAMVLRFVKNATHGAREHGLDRCGSPEGRGDREPCGDDLRRPKDHNDLPEADGNDHGDRQAQVAHEPAE